MLCALGVVRDTETNNISVFNILEQVTPGAFPAVVPESRVLVMLEKEGEEPEGVEGKLTVKMDEDAEPIQAVQFRIDFQGKRSFRAIIFLRNLPILHAGHLHFLFSIGTEEKGRYSVLVKAPTPPAIEAGTIPT